MAAAAPLQKLGEAAASGGGEGGGGGAAAAGGGGVNPRNAGPWSAAGKVCIVTGAAGGIGRALCVELGARGASVVVCADIDVAGAEETARLVESASTGGSSTSSGGAGAGEGSPSAWVKRCDVSRESDIQGVIAETVRREGRVDVFVANAGILVLGGAEVPNDMWDRIMAINVMQHIWAARHLEPLWRASHAQDPVNGGGYLVVTASAAGLLTQVGGLPYAVTKRAAVSVAEWLSITYGDAGMRVACLCPQAVDTAMTASATADAKNGNVAGVDGIITAEKAATDTVDGMQAGRFLVLPHPEVELYIKRKADNYDRWIKGMRRLNEMFVLGTRARL